MRRLGISLSLVALVLVACDGGSSLVVTEEPAGANCATGGFRIEADGEVFYSCGDQAMTENVDAGAEGNPCLGAAIRLTIPVEDGTTQHAYVCQPFDVDETAVAALTTGLDLTRAQSRIECICEADPEAQFVCELSVARHEAFVPVIEGCADDVVALASPIPSADRPMLECMVEASADVTACFDAIADECSQEAREMAEACVLVMEEAKTNCGAPSATLQQWLTTAQTIGYLMGCDLMYGVFGELPM